MPDFSTLLLAFSVATRSASALSTKVSAGDGWLGVDGGGLLPPPGITSASTAASAPTIAAIALQPAAPRRRYQGARSFSSRRSPRALHDTNLPRVDAVMGPPGSEAVPGGLLEYRCEPRHTGPSKRPCDPSPFRAKQKRAWPVCDLCPPLDRRIGADYHWRANQRGASDPGLVLVRCALRSRRLHLCRLFRRCRQRRRPNRAKPADRDRGRRGRPTALRARRRSAKAHRIRPGGHQRLPDRCDAPLAGGPYQGAEAAYAQARKSRRPYPCAGRRRADAEIPGASSVAILVDLAIPARHSVPDHLGNHLHYALGPTPLTPAIGSYTVHRRLRVERRKPLVISPPLRGPGWLDGNSCCDPSAPHRYTLLPANGRLNPIETFAIDWLRMRGGVVPRRRPSARRLPGLRGEDPQRRGRDGGLRRRRSARGADQPAPDRSVRPQPRRVPGQPSDRADPPGQIRRLRAHAAGLGSGQAGAAGANRRGARPARKQQQQHHAPPSLLDQNAPHPLASSSLPFVIDRFRFVGHASGGPTPPQVTLTGTPRRERRGYPLSHTVDDFSR